MTEQIITYNGASITLKRATVRSRLHNGIIYRKFDVDDHTSDEEFSMLFNYVKFLTQTAIDGDIGFQVLTYADEPEALQAGFETFLDQPEAFFDAVIIPLTRIDSPFAEDAVQPLDEHQKKA